MNNKTIYSTTQRPSSSLSSVPFPVIYPKWTNTSSALQFSPSTAVKHQHGFPQHYYPQLRFQLVPPLQALKTHQIPTIHAGKTITIPTTIVYQLLIRRPLWQKNGLSPCPVGKMLVSSLIWSYYSASLNVISLSSKTYFSIINTRRLFTREAISPWYNGWFRCGKGGCYGVLEH